MPTMLADYQLQNRALLKRSDPYLLAELERLPGVEQDLSHSDDVSDQVGGTPQQLHLHFGLGHGDLLKADQPAPDGQILIYEPNPERVRQFMKHKSLEQLLQHKSATICCTFERFAYLVMKACSRPISYRVVINRSQAQTQRAAMARFGQLVDNLAAEMMGARRTRLFPKVMASTLASLPYQTQLPGFEHWRGHLKGVPAMIVAAGPSLKRNIAAVAHASEHAAVFALGRTSGILEEYGVAPDFLVHVEAQDFARFIAQRKNLSETTFLLADQCHPYYYQYPHGRTYVFQSRANPISNSLSARFPEMAHEIVKTGGSVATAAFYLAAQAGCDPIILVGQDLAFTGGQWYSGRENEQKLFEEQRTTAGYFGGEVITDKNFHTNILWYAQSAKALKQQQPQRRLINATEGGARLEGFEQMSFTHAAHNFLREPVSITQPPMESWPKLDQERLQAYVVEVQDFFTKGRQAVSKFAQWERQLLDDIARKGSVSDPLAALDDYMQAYRGAEHLKPLQAVETRIAAQLYQQHQHVSNQPEGRLRIWASLAALHEGFTALDQQFPSAALAGSSKI